MNSQTTLEPSATEVRECPLRCAPAIAATRTLSAPSGRATSESTADVHIGEDCALGCDRTTCSISAFRKTNLNLLLHFIYSYANVVSCPVDRVFRCDLPSGRFELLDLQRRDRRSDIIGQWAIDDRRPAELSFVPARVSYLKFFCTYDIEDS